MKKKICKCEYPYEKCDNVCECEPIWVQWARSSKLVYVCPDCKKKNEERLERIRSNYRAQFGENWH